MVSVESLTPDVDYFALEDCVEVVVVVLLAVIVEVEVEMVLVVIVEVEMVMLLVYLPPVGVMRLRPAKHV